MTLFYPIYDAFTSYIIRFRLQLRYFRIHFSLFRRIYDALSSCIIALLCHTLSHTRHMPLVKRHTLLRFCVIVVVLPPLHADVPALWSCAFVSPFPPTRLRFFTAAAALDGFATHVSVLLRHIVVLLCHTSTRLCVIAGICMRYDAFVSMSASHRQSMMLFRHIL